MNLSNNNPDLNSRLNTIILKIKKLGYSLTPQRLEIIKIISESKKHPSAIDVYNELKKIYPMVSLNTVYKNLSLLASLHEINEIRTLQNSAHYDGDISPHGHAICEKCGKIIDIRKDGFDFRELFENKIKIKLAENFHIINYGIEFYGLCGSCFETA